ncbi:hypothetical protein [Anditalea andensis]|uniref:Uncharacterized protein n=1 Tax=Anditalea andensis TaxID=1048983 RepID=A0A074KZJ9_9BACT|nr:hypothetical protein [Anditalea andensis]KEO75426.1 hypothetical protein EL17_00770 [Anditalea andensis]
MRLFYTYTLILLGSCIHAQDEDIFVNTDDWSNDVRNMLRKDLLQPEGNLHMILSYDSEDESTLKSIKKFFYNSKGQEILNLGFSAQNDTVTVWIPLYNQKKELSELKTYRYPNWEFQQNLSGVRLDDLEWSSTSFYSYDVEGRLVLTEFSSPIYERQPRKALHYNEHGLLEKEEYFQHYNPIGYTAYVYNEDRKLIKESEFSNGGDTPLRVYLMRYDENGLLVAKETGELYNADLELKDVHKYVYDDQKMLVEEKEYYPNLGFQMVQRLIYVYHSTSEHD